MRIAVFSLLVYWVSLSPASGAQALTWRGAPGFRLADLGDPESPCAVRYEIDASQALCLRAVDWRRALDSDGWGCPAVFTGTWKETRALGPGPTDTRVFRRFQVRAWQAEPCRQYGRRVLNAIDRARWRWSQRLVPFDSFGVLRHLLLSQRTSVLATVPWRELGFVHVLTLTGIHLYALASAVDRIFGTLLAGRAARVAIAKRAARGVSIFVWVLAWLMSGARAGLLRPGWVVLLHWGVGGSGHRWRRYSAIGLALVVDAVLAWGLPALDERWQDFAMGRAHYALAVVGGLLGASLAQKQKAWRQHAAMAIGSWLAVVPLDAWQHGMVAPLTPVLSVVTIPWIASVVTPGLLGALTLDWSLGIEALARLNDGVLAILVEGVRAGDAVWLLPAVAWPAGALLAVVAAHHRMAAGFLAITLVAALPLPSPLMRQWNTGQGDAAVARFANGRAWVLDTGPAFSARPAVWFHRFASVGVGRVDRVVLSHLDEDHRGGLSTLLAWVRVDGGTVRADLHEGARTRYPELKWAAPAGAPPGWTWFEPPPVHGANGQMLGWAWQIGSQLYLNLGDASLQLERELAPPISRLPAGRWTWKLSHHGSRTSTPPEWFGRFPIQEVWISAGHGNLHGHPHSQVLRKIPAAVRLRATAQEGDLDWPGL